MPRVVAMRVRRGAGVAAAAALAVLLGACSGPGETAAPEPAPTSAQESDESPTGEPSSTAAPVADPAHAVEPPGKRKGRLWSADILVQWDKAIDDDLLAKIEKLKGVAHTER